MLQPLPCDETSLSETTFCDFNIALIRLGKEIASGRVADCSFERVDRLLALLPLSSLEYSVSASQLRSVRRYDDIGETGAAIYELRMLIRSLKHMGPVIFFVGIIAHAELYSGIGRIMNFAFG